MYTNSVNGSTVAGIPVTTQVTDHVSPTLLRSEIDERVAKIRPSSTPLDQISRLAGARHSSSMKVDYYSVDIKPATSSIQTTMPQKTYSYGDNFSITVSDNAFLSKSDTIFFPTVMTTEGKQLIGYVAEIDGRTATVIPVNVLPDDNDNYTLPLIAKNTKVVRMGRAAGELDVQTPQFNALPVKKDNLCQIFKSQIEESLLQRLSDKEVGWTFSDQEEVAILDMRMCMERSFMFGNKKKITVEDGSEVMLTGGIWHQTDKDFTYDPATLDNKTLISMMRRAFSESNGSTRKVLLAGSGLIERLNTLDMHRVVSGNQRVTKWGVDFDYLVSKFGSLYVARCEVFDLCGMEDFGMVIDPEYITKYSHIPFSAERISFHKQGVRNTEAVVLTEASCLVLRYPNAHMRILPTT